jgi:RNA polymerase sigma-70 factor (ECF subfamily)
MQKDRLFNEILAENRDRIYRICCAYVPDTDERDDLFQEIVINIWRNLDKFEGRSLISTWIYRIAVNSALLHIRTAKKRKERHTEINENTLNVPENDDKTEKINTGKQIEKLYYAINRLNELDRLIISMVLDDLSYKEIADVTGMTVTNTGVKINRIKKELNRLMNNGN